MRDAESALIDKFGVVSEGFDSTSVGPTFGQQVADSALKALIFSMLVICGYVALRFDPKFAVPVLIAIFHDILITAGVYSLTGKEVSSGTVAAFLTILGYSIYDTIIVFDRIRENVPRMPRAAFSQIVNRSMSEVLTRSLATSFSTLLGVTSLLVFGGAILQDFAFAMLVGIASGTYSSIFIASPVLTAWKEREPGFVRRRLRIAEVEGGRVPAYADDIEMAELRTRRRGGSGHADRGRGSGGGADRGGGGHGRASRRLRQRRRHRISHQRRHRGRRLGLGRAPSAQRRAPRPPTSTTQAREAFVDLMALLVFFIMGIALWHFTVFLPDRFWQGIVGAFIGAVLGSIVFGMIVQEASGKGLGDTDLSTALIAVPGTSDRAWRSSTRSASGPKSRSAEPRVFAASSALRSAPVPPHRFLAWEACRIVPAHLRSSPTPTQRRMPSPRISA